MAAVTEGGGRQGSRDDRCNPSGIQTTSNTRKSCRMLRFESLLMEKGSSVYCLSEDGTDNT